MDSLLLFISAVLSWCLILCLAAAILLLGRTQAALARQLEELEITASSHSTRGRPAPPFQLSTLDGKQVLDLDTFKGQVMLIFFLSPGCIHCHRFLQTISTLLPQLYTQQIAVIGISDGDPASMLHLVEELNVDFPVLHEEQWQISRRYGVLGRPWGVAIDATGIVRGSGPVSSQAQIAGLVQTVVPSLKMPATSARLKQI